MTTSKKLSHPSVQSRINFFSFLPYFVKANSTFADSLNGRVVWHQKLFHVAKEQRRNDFYVFINFMTFWMNSHYHNPCLSSTQLSLSFTFLLFLYCCEKNKLLHVVCTKSFVIPKKWTFMILIFILFFSFLS